MTTIKTATVVFSRQYEFSSGRASTLEMREPLVADQRAASAVKGDQAAQEVALFANLLMLTPKDIDMLTLRDYKHVQETYMGFLA